MIFSDNVPIEDEVRLKQIGDREGLLVMALIVGLQSLRRLPRLCEQSA